MNPSFISLERSQDKITFVRQAILENLIQGRDIFPSSHQGQWDLAVYPLLSRWRRKPS